MYLPFERYACFCVDYVRHVGRRGRQGAQLEVSQGTRTYSVSRPLQTADVEMGATRATVVMGLTISVAPSGNKPVNDLGNAHSKTLYRCLSNGIFPSGATRGGAISAHSCTSTTRTRNRTLDRVEVSPPRPFAGCQQMRK
jgi:hypothetical protein